jgi:Raf kinase inhibitor-like YbhB/YbcL family protein
MKSTAIVPAVLGLVVAVGAAGAAAAGLSAGRAQNPPPAQQAGAPPPRTPPPGQRGGGRGRGGVQVMTLSTTAWQDGGLIPLRYTQAGDEVSPPLKWSDPPTTAQSFVLIVHDLDATNADGTTTTLHWMVWNIPAAARGLPEHVPQGAELPDGSRQISATGPYYRGPAAPAAGPEHHYVFDLFALDATIDVKPVGATVAQTRAAVVAAMAGHVRGKATLVGRFKYGER